MLPMICCSGAENSCWPDVSVFDVINFHYWLYKRTIFLNESEYKQAIHSTIVAAP
jgi:hypothetical protein